MVIKVYISSVTCNNQQRKNQHTILSKLQAEKVDFIKIDVTDPKHNQEKQHMRELSKSRKEGTFAVPPQIFNDSEYCGDYEAFADALETQNLWEFLKMDYGLHRDEFTKGLENLPKELQDQLKQKIEDDDSLIGFNKEGEEEKKDEEGGEKTKEAIIEEEEEKVVEEAKEGDEEEKKEEKEEDTKETEADEKTDEEVEKKEEVFADNEQLETQESEESEQKTEIEEKVDKAEEVEEEKKTEESETQE